MIRLVSGNIPDHYILLILTDLSKKLVEMDGGNLSEDAPETFENIDSIRASIPSFDEMYLKVPKVLNKE
ncbi:hypothetical protein YC2023_043377 [Brassica napus]